MTTETSIAEATDTRTLLGEGAGSTEATPPLNRLDDGFEQYAADYLTAHPEISHAIPPWAEDIVFSTIEDEIEGTLFSFSTDIGDVELYGVGRVTPQGVVVIDSDGMPNIYLPTEIDCDKIPSVTERLLSLSKNCIAAALLLRAGGRS